MSLASVIEEALNQREQMKAQGMTDAELAEGFEQVVREVWPFTREWKYLCNTCNDTGLELRNCPDGQLCGLGKGKQHEHPHEYGVPCFCSLGARFKKRGPTPEDDVAKAARTTRKPSRFGERDRI